MLTIKTKWSFCCEKLGDYKMWLLRNRIELRKNVYSAVYICLIKLPIPKSSIVMGKFRNYTLHSIIMLK